MENDAHGGSFFSFGLFKWLKSLKCYNNSITVLFPSLKASTYLLTNRIIDIPNNIFPPQVLFDI